jgi:signal peptidase I
MFTLFASQEKRMRRNAANWLELADKVWVYRRDRLTEGEAADLTGRRDELRRHLRERADAGKLKLSIEALEAALRRAGGVVYPKSSLTENVEFFLVAAIVILGIRTYFVQPFKIPTNSMWPTYYGMTAENLPPGAAAPGLVERTFRLLAFGAQRREATAPRSGEVSAQFLLNGQMACTVRTGRSWLVFPTQVREYTFYVDGAPATVQVPYDFDEFDKVVRETFFGSDRGFAMFWRKAIQEGRFEGSLLRPSEDAEEMQRVVTLPLGRTVREGEPILRFDLMTGDQLFVDRVTYNFVRPRVGQGFVFRTDNIPGIGRQDYYIKRLVGVPGDVMEIRAPTLYRNGRPITGSEVFDLQTSRTPPYTGYTFGDSVNGGVYLAKGATLRVPEGGFFAMGDNSSNSSDGRVWGFVPAKDAVGRPLFIYFPFTRRWGPAR